MWYFPSRRLSLCSWSSTLPPVLWPAVFLFSLSSRSRPSNRCERLVAVLHLADAFSAFTLYVLSVFPGNWSHDTTLYQQDDFIVFSLLSLYPQGYEDWIRHKADNAINQCPVHVIQHGKVVRKQSQKLRVRNHRIAPVHTILFSVFHTDEIKLVIFQYLKDVYRTQTRIMTVCMSTTILFYHNLGKLSDSEPLLWFLFGNSMLACQQAEWQSAPTLPIMPQESLIVYNCGTIALSQLFIIDSF